MASPRLSGLFADRYLIEQELGHGATAVVYLAHDNKQNREIALKVLSKDLAHALGPQRFLREIQLTARLQHPHILPIFDSGEWEDMLYYVMPLVRGESLREKIDRESQLPIEECVRITCEVADALSHAHAQDIVHRDVKPENIMLSDGHALLADFGIARTLDVHTGERLTSSGLIVGTSAYMSPEQASGEEHIDARSDIYSLACVLYEMIAGVQAFTGPNTQSVIAQRFKHTPRPVSTYRPQVPEYIDEVLAKAFAIAPADRYKDIKKFSSDLNGAVEPTIQDRRRSPLRRAIYDRQKVFGFAAAAIVLVMAAAVIANPPGHWSSLIFRHAALDSTKFIVVPAPSPGQSEIGEKDIAAAVRLSRALHAWSGLTVIDAEDVKDAVSAKQVRQSGDAFELAKRYAAGRLIRVNSNGDASLSDVATGDVLNVISATEVKDAADRDSVSVLKLLAGKDRPAGALGGDGLTHSLPAWKAYGRGHSLIAIGRFAEAQRSFAQALEFDADYTPAQLWNAQVKAWMTPDSVASWSEPALNAASRATELAPRDSALAAALAAMATSKFPEACKHYSRLTKQDPLDFAGWYGLGECNQLDSLVVRDAASPSGWSFEGSYGTAADAYLRAGRILPSAYEFTFAKMEGLLPVASIRIRGGKTAAPAPGVMGAYPSMSRDTLAFVPYPIAQFVSLPKVATLSHTEALRHNRQLLLSFASEWERRAPQNPAALEALATSLETNGSLLEPGAGLPSAIEAVRKAKTLSSNSAQLLRLAAAEVRLRIKLGDFGGAEKLADSVLRSAREGDPYILTRLAAVTGRRSEMARWAARAHIPMIVGFASPVPAQLAQTAADFFASGALGICGEATQRLETQLEQQLQSYVRESERPAMRAAIEARSLGMMTPCTNGKSALRIDTPRDRLNRVQQVYGRGNYARVQTMLDSIRRSRSDRLPGDISFDYTYQEAWLRAAVGDTSGATRTLDLTLNALPSLSIPAIDEAAASAALGRAFILRADLAQKQNDLTTARKSAAAAAALWARADAELQPEVRRMRALAGMR